MKSKICERLIPLNRANHQWDIEFWQSQSPEIRFGTNWDLVVDSYRIKGKKINANTLRLHRTVESIKLRKG
ncbi:MAG: hypothetical protein AB1599_01445 [Planctomycetota bacterium]